MSGHGCSWMWRNNTCQSTVNISGHHFQKHLNFLHLVEEANVIITKRGDSIQGVINAMKSAYSGTYTPTDRQTPRPPCCTHDYAQATYLGMAYVPTDRDVSKSWLTCHCRSINCFYLTCLRSDESKLTDWLADCLAELPTICCPLTFFLKTKPQSALERAGFKCKKTHQPFATYYLPALLRICGHEILQIGFSSSSLVFFRKLQTASPSLSLVFQGLCTCTGAD